MPTSRRRFRARAQVDDGRFRLRAAIVADDLAKIIDIGAGTELGDVEIVVVAGGKGTSVG